MTQTRFSVYVFIREVNWKLVRWSRRQHGGCSRSNESAVIVVAKMTVHLVNTGDETAKVLLTTLIIMHAVVNGVAGELKGSDLWRSWPVCIVATSVKLPGLDMHQS